jgi:RNA polymerase sigma factor (sigma-70 family)
MKELSEALVRLRRGELSWEKFYRLVYAHLTMLLVRRFQFESDTARELLADFYPKLVRICRDYQDSGSTFEAYLYTCVRYYVSEWTRQRRNRRRREVLIGCCDETPLAVAEEVETDLDPGTHCIESGLAILANSRQRDTVRRQLLICLCKNIPLLTSAEIERYAALFGLPLGWLISVEASLLERRDRVGRTRTRYREQRDRHYASMLDAGNRLRLRGGSAEVVSEFHRRRWNYYRDRLQHQTVHLSNREVADILGISKGSVDSALSNLSKRLAVLAAGTVPSGHGTPAPRVKQSAQALRNGRNHPPARSGGDSSAAGGYRLFL